MAVLAPYAWLAIFFLLPFLIVLKISLSQSTLSAPPYAPLFDPDAGWEGLKAFVAALFARQLLRASRPTRSIACPT